jgi:hypothetical protein
MPFRVTPNVRVKRDVDGVARHLNHLQAPYLATDTVALTPLALAQAYVRDVADIYGINPELLATLGERITREVKEEGSRLRFLEQKTIAGTTVVGYQQTHLGLPVWEASLTVRMRTQPLGVTSSENTIHFDVKVSRPSRRAKYLPDSRAATALLQGLVTAAKGRLTKITGLSLLIYRYDPAMRLDPESRPRLADRGLEGDVPTLPLPPVPTAIRPGLHYVVTEGLFTTSLPPWRALNWRIFIEVETGAIVYLRAFVTSAFGNVFRADPLTATGGATITPCSPAGTLDPLTTVVSLPGLTPPAPGNPQPLSGEYVALGELAAPAIAAPTAALPAGNFSYSAPTDNFAAVNAYYHCDGLFRMMADMGFDLAAYFPDTAFPLTVDHRDASLGIVNARAYGNATGNGAGGMGYNLAQAGCPVGIAADVRVMLHEFSHELLWEHVNSSHTGFSHSAGDSLAAILLDPDSQAPDRFVTFPWIALLTRRHDGDVAAGWAWGGTKDDTKYLSEQVLSTTMFRIYRSTGGDSFTIEKRRFAARYVAYVIIKSIGILTATTTDPEVYATALMDADTGTPEFEGIAGGGIHKVIRWSFEKQGLYQPPGAPIPVSSPGDPPDVDVYIDDGRNGEYQYLDNFWNTTAIWNRLTPAGGVEADHETPVVGITNYLYVRVKNRGTQAATNVVVRACHCVPATGLVWPDDWQPTTTPELLVPGALPPGGDAIVGPFEWTPEVIGHECLLAAVSADGDLSNVDPASGLPSATGPSPHWRLVPFDNNIAQRNVAPVAGGGGGLNLAASFERRRFRARNPYTRAVRVTLDVALPDFLRKRGWEIRFQNPGGASFTLGPRDGREVVMSLKRGTDFSAADVISAAPKAGIEIITLVDGIPIGGMTYAIDPRLKTPPVELPRAHGAPDRGDAAKRLLECLNLPSDDVKSVRVKSVDVTIHLKHDC